MARNRSTPSAAIEPHQFKTIEEINRGIQKLERRIQDLNGLDISKAVTNETGEDNVVISDVRNAIRDVFGQNSPEYEEHKFIRLWAGAMYMDMPDYEVLEAKNKGRIAVVNVLKGLIRRLQETREELFDDSKPTPTSYFAKLNLHPRISDVSEELFMDGHHWEAVFAASKALVNYVKEKSGSDLDGTKMMYSVFSRTNPTLAFADVSDQTGGDIQEGMMHLFVGATLAIRNPGGHAFPEGSEQRAFEYISLLSTLAYHLQEAKKRKPSG